MLDKRPDYMVRYVGIMVTILLGTIVMLSFMGCATTPDNPRNDKIIATMDSIFDTYELFRIAKGQKTVAELIAMHPDKVALWMAGVESSIHLMESFGADAELLQSLQDEFKEKFLVAMKVPVI